MSEKSKERRKHRQEFLLTFFDEKPEYQKKEMNGFWLIKHFNSKTENWQVDIFTKESYQNYKNHKKINQANLL